MSFDMSSNLMVLNRLNADHSSDMKLSQSFCNFDYGFSSLSLLLFVCWQMQDSNYSQKTSGRKRLPKLVAALHKHTASMVLRNKILLAVCLPCDQRKVDFV